jgi:hypothetical protein
MSAQIYKFIEIIAAGASESGSPSVNGTSIFSLATENRTVTNDAVPVQIENAQEVTVSFTKRFEVRVYDTRLNSSNNIYVNTGVTGALGQVCLHRGDGTGIKLDNVRVTAVRKYDDVEDYVSVSCQANETTEISNFT